jgi:hypothetical protein
LALYTFYAKAEVKDQRAFVLRPRLREKRRDPCQPFPATVNAVRM